MINFETITYALLGGVLPALVWLMFWLREDHKHPEPKRLLLKTFVFGMCAVILVLPLQKAVDMWVDNLVTAMILWVTFEEILKLGAAYIGGLSSKEDNEPIDPIIYMITAALGFVALENVLFLIGPIVGEQFSLEAFFVTGNLRFIGASLLHVVSSSIIGVALSFSFYKSQRIHKRLVLTALVLAIIFHAIFNLSIMQWGGAGIMVSFLGVWFGVVLLLLAFEKAKTIVS